MGNAHAKEIIIISDVHISDCDSCPRYQLLKNFIAKVDPSETTTLVLLGDIFDFALGSHRYFQKKFSDFYRELQKINRKGIRVVFVEGNHEFFIDRMPWDGVEFATKKNFQLLLKNGAEIKFSHGDLLLNEWSYKVFRTCLRNGLAREVSKLVPGSWLDRFALYLARKSRQKSKDRQMDFNRIIPCFDRWQTDGSQDLCVVGHFHYPFALQNSEALKNSRFEFSLVGLPSWGQPNALVVNSAHIMRRIFIDKNGSQRVENLRPSKTS